MKAHSRQRGVALLVAIIIFAVATTVAAAITYNKAMAARRAAATFTMEQALQAGMAAEALAAIALQNDGPKPRTETTQDWAQVQPPIEIEGTGVWIQAQLEDLQGRFNLNSLVYWDQQNNTFLPDQHQLTVFRTLLNDLDIDMNYADLLVDWIDPDIAPSSNSGGGGEDTLYMSQSPPYRPPNYFIWHPSELLALPNFGRENYQKIAPYVTALPYDTQVNVCTASGLVLDVTRNDPANQHEYVNTDLKQMRENGCFPQRTVFTGVISDPATRQQAEQRTTEDSNWFRLRTNIRIGTAEFVLYSVLFREPGNKIRTVQRSFGSE
ncbi:MAG TPA: type II secretion system minor pseudopilin GspK [Steroidobacteraceae bacterium]|nr:type II secretion system minor pseudopilin GspK [Steroidobacteraceae bacterium]